MRSAVGRNRRLQPPDDARAVDVPGGPYLQQPAGLAGALELVRRIDEHARRSEEIDSHVVLERRESTHVLPIYGIDGHAPLDRRYRVGRAFGHKSAELLEEHAFVR